eukprot:TRINITY_DN23762_c0_g1_i12.p2 TRINITY_DN23762_c0_g1~~TRINITY_DN23762_c0_g1_i12.p2  ORF type:complete len:137 (+),score=19.82 TRINITY_DN23762_c0_g1_i12:116-526(+)
MFQNQIQQLVCKLQILATIKEVESLSLLLAHKLYGLSNQIELLLAGFELGVAVIGQQQHADYFDEDIDIYNQMKDIKLSDYIDSLEEQLSTPVSQKLLLDNQNLDSSDQLSEKLPGTLCGNENGLKSAFVTEVRLR